MPRVSLHYSARVSSAIRRLLGNERLFEYCSEEAAAKPHQHDLTDDERLAVWMYSAATVVWSEHINKELWTGKPTPDVLLFADLLNGALRKLPKHVGLSYRGYHSSALGRFVADHAPGQLIQWLGFTSTSRRLEQAYPGNLLFTINSHTGRVLGHYAEKPEEEEVLFASGSWFRVVALERLGDFAVVELDEVPQ